VLEEGTPVFTRDGRRIGVVEHVLADMQLDIFEGVVVETRPLPVRHLYADAGQIAELRERGVVLSVGRNGLQRPGDDSRRQPARGGKSPLEARLRRAWDWLGRRR
jgi:uncharacterized protein YrrD